MSEQRFIAYWTPSKTRPTNAANMSARAELMRGKVDIFSLDTLVNAGGEDSAEESCVIQTDR